MAVADRCRQDLIRSRRCSFTPPQAGRQLGRADSEVEGAYVIGTASARNPDLVRQLGADEVIDYQAVKFEEIARDVGVVLDTVGGDTEQRSWRVLKRGGILVSIVSSPSPEIAKEHGVRQAFVFIEPNAAHLAALANPVDSGKLRAVIETILPLAEARRGHEISQSGHARGKIVLRIR